MPREPASATGASTFSWLRPAWRRGGLFLGVVVIPTLLAAIYFLLLATPIYVSEAHFIVRTPGQSAPSALSSVLQGVGFSLAETDAFAVHEYITSRDAVAALEARNHLRQVLARPGADVLARFPRPFERQTNENLFRAYKRFVSVGYDATTGMSTLTVKAFRPEDAQAMANTLLDGGEALVNRLNDRAERDALTEARREVTEAEQRVADAQQKLTGFRNRERMIDPNRSSVAGSDLVSRLSGQLATLRAERAGLAAAAPRSPDLAGLDDRIHAYEGQIEVERAKVAGQDNSLAPKIADYERLTLERDFAGREATSAESALETARLQLRRQRLYLQRVVSPNLPDAPILPRRWLSLATFFASVLLAYGIIVLVRAGLREQHG